MERHVLSPLGSSLLCDGEAAQAVPAVTPPIGTPATLSVTPWSLSPSTAPLLTPWQLALADTLEREESDAKAAQRAAAASPSAVNFYNPEAWRKAFKSMTRTALFQHNQVSLFHDSKAGLNMEHDLRLGCCVRVLPRLSVIKAALQRLSERNIRRKVSTYDVWESAATAAAAASERGNSTRGRSKAAKDADRVVPSYQPTPTVWAVSEGNEQEILVFDAFTGRRLMRIVDPKLSVPPTAIAHAPFRGFMNRQLHVVPVNKPRDILRLKETQLINTDYVWVGFADGAIRLFPADHERLRETDRATQLSKGEMADVVFELPKHHAASIVSIARSPCHHDDEGADYSTRNRLSSAVHYMTAAGTSSANNAASSATNSGKKKGGGGGAAGSREHLSLICTASVDSVVVVWDIRKIYQALEALRTLHREEAANVGLTSTRSAVNVMSNEVVTIEGAHPLFTVRSSCTMVKVRPLMRLKGGVAGFKSLQWVSTLVTSAGFTQPRDVAELTRDVEESSAPKLLRQRRQRQLLTRFQRREKHRAILNLCEEDMKALEELLDEMMPSLKEEPIQSMRVNLLVAGDNVGTVHMWNLDEELRKSMSDTIATARSIRSAATTPHQSPSRKESPGRNSHFSAAQYSTASPSVQLSAVGSAQAKDRVRTVSGKLKNLKKRQSLKTTESVTGSSASALGAATPLGQRSGGSTVKKTPRSGMKSSSGGGGASSTKKKKGATPCRGSAVKKAADSAAPTYRATGRLSTLGSTSTATTHRPATSLGLGTTALTASSTHGAGTSKTRKRAMPLLSKASKGIGAAEDGDEDGAKPAPRGSLSTLRSSVSPSRPRPSMTLSESSLDRHGSVGRSAPRHSTGHGTHSAARPSPSRARHEDSRASPQRQPNTPSKAGDRTARSRANEYLSRASQCRIEFTGGVAITGMAVDLPPVLVRTLRRLPETQTERVSLLEKPSPEQVLRRTLENEFEPLTEEKALFFVLQQLQIYVSVEGTVLNLRCDPQWNAADADGRELFKIHHTTEADLHRLPPLYRPRPQQNDVRVDGAVTFADFGVSFHKTMLEGHSQPVTMLFLDVARRLVWVARNGGLMSLFSTDTKRIVTRVPHPCADSALGPPNTAEWRALQAEFLRHQDEPVHLERHKETLKYKPAFFRGVIPFSTRSQASLVLVTSAVRVNDGFMLDATNYEYAADQKRLDVYDAFQRSGHDRPRSVSLGASSLFSEPAWPNAGALLEVQRIDGRSDTAAPTRRREKRLKEVLDHLRLCRVSAVLVRKAEKEEYEQYGDRISANVAYIIHELGAYAAVPILRRSFQTWLTHTRHFRHEHVMRKQRTSRLERARFLALGLERNCHRLVAAQYFVKWLRWRALQRIEQQDACLWRLLGRLSSTRTCPTSEMMLRLWEFRARQHCWGAWQRFVSGRHQLTVAALRSAGAGVHECLQHQSPLKSHGEQWDGRAGSPLRRTATAKYRTSSIVGAHMGGTAGARRGTGTLGAVDSRVLTFDDGEELRPVLVHSDAEDEEDAFSDGVPASCLEDRDGDDFGRVIDATPAAPLDHLEDVNAEDTEGLLAHFRHITYAILHARAATMHFEESDAVPDSVLDESWMSIVESAEAGAENQDDADSRRLSVFRYGLLALLQGLLSTADDVLPNLDNSSVADEVASMLLGIQLCMDYVAADADVTLSKVGDRFVAATLFKSITSDGSPRRSRSLLRHTVPLLTRTATQAPPSRRASHQRQSDAHSSTPSPGNPSDDGSATPVDTTDTAASPLLLSHEDACLCVLEVYARRALEDEESRAAMIDIVRDRESLDVFIAFVSDERPERHRSTSSVRV